MRHERRRDSLCARRGRALGRWVWALAVVGVSCLVVASAIGKEHALRSPSGRRIYGPQETFAEVMDQNRRRFVAEVAAGAGPEGNLALLLGCLNLPVDRLDVYLGVGLEANPARIYGASARYTLHVGEARPYLSAGYLLKETFEVGLRSHNVFAEVGYRWLVHRTYHLMVGVGLRRILDTRVTEESLLRSRDIDRELLDDALDELNPWLPTVALRFSRAF